VGPGREQTIFREEPEDWGCSEISCYFHSYRLNCRKRVPAGMQGSCGPFPMKSRKISGPIPSVF